MNVTRRQFIKTTAGAAGAMAASGILLTPRGAQAYAVSTLRELGINAGFQQVRSIAAPKDLPAEAVRYYEDLFRKLAESKWWKEKYIQENMMTWDYKNSAETMKLWDGNNEFCARTMKEMGVIK